MNKELFEHLLSELKIQTNFAIISINLLNEQFSEIRNESISVEENVKISYTFWYSIQNYVVSLANISKILYGVKGKTPQNEWLKRKSERKILRSQINISYDSVFRERGMRNLLEHIDEHIESFVKSNPNIIIDRAIGPKNGMIQIENDSFYNSNFYNLRAYLTDVNEFWLFDKKISIQDTFEQTLRLRDSIIEAEKKLKDGDLNDIFS